METGFITTRLGEIAYYANTVEGTVPLILLHGVYYDHALWHYQMSNIADRTVVALDMPMHGRSKSSIKKDWTLHDCSEMLIEVLTALGYPKVYAVGHSWGSMTILRAACRYPERFEAIGLCNLPVNPGNAAAKLKFGFLHPLLIFRAFYTTQVAKTMFSKENNASNPRLIDYLKRSMGQLSNREVRYTDRAVITHVDDGRVFIEQLMVPALGLSGDQDYVGLPPRIKSMTVPGGHTSPLEQPDAVLKFIQKVTLKKSKATGNSGYAVQDSCNQ